jgi:hypothetical protein
MRKRVQGVCGVAVMVVLILLAISTSSAQRPADISYGASMQGASRISIGVGADYLRKDDPPDGHVQSLWRLAALSLRLGVASNVDFTIDWRGWLYGRRTDGSTRSAGGDLTVTTGIHLVGECGARPAFAIQSIVKLPNTPLTNDLLGSDETDYFFHVLASKRLQPFEICASAGFGIVGIPNDPGWQDDLYLASIGAWIPAAGLGRAFVELYGFTGYRRDDSKLLARAGFRDIQAGPLQMDVYGGARVRGSERDFAASFEGGESWSAGLVLRRTFRW